MPVSVATPVGLHLAVQAGQLEGTAAGLLVVLFIMAALTTVWIWAVWRLLRERKWKEALLEAAMVVVWTALLAGGTWLLTSRISHGWDVARRAIPEYCPQVRGDVEGGTPPMEAGRAAVRRMREVEPAIRTLSLDELSATLLRECRRITGWDGFRVVEDTADGGAPADTAGGPSIAPRLPGR